VKGGNVNSLLAHTASLTTTLADRDQVIGRTITNLNTVLGTIDARDDQLSSLLTELQRFVSGLADDRAALGASLTNIAGLAESTSGLLKDSRPAIRTDVKQLGRVAGTLDDNKALVDKWLKNLPNKLNTITRTATYGSWFNFYLCDFEGRVILSKHRQLLAELPLGCGEVPVMTPFRERNPVIIGAIGLAVIAAMLLLAFNTDKLPLLGGRHHFRRPVRGRRAEAGRRRADRRSQGRQGHVGRPGERARARQLHRQPLDRARQHDECRCADQRPFSVRSSWRSTRPASRHCRRRSHCPARRRPYDVVDAFSDLATTAEDIDTEQLATSLDTIADTFRDSPADVRAAVEGLGRLSHTVASRDEQLRSLLDHANGVTGVLSDRNAQIVSLLADGDLLLQELRKRRADIHTLLVNTATLADQLTGLVRDNRAAIRPALAHLKNVLAVLETNQANLDRSIRLLAPFVRVFANTTGQRTLVRHLHPEPRARSRRRGGARHEAPRDWGGSGARTAGRTRRPVPAA
jgi:phospholipid/cholesterol/gamma-HCH transport system substrate-binding protein